MNLYYKRKSISGFSNRFKSGMEIGNASVENQDKEVAYKLKVLLPAAMTEISGASS